MATATREESDEEFNPFLSPEAPPLSNPVVAAPALPPRSNGGSGGAAAGGAAAGASSRRRGSSRTSTGAGDGGGGGNPFAPSETAAVQGQPENRTPSARTTGTSHSPNARPAPSATSATTTSTTATCGSSSSRSGGNSSTLTGTQHRSGQTPAASTHGRGGSPPSRNANGGGAPASSSSSTLSAPTAPTGAAGSTHRRSGRSAGGSGGSSGSGSSRATTVSPSPAPTPAGTSAASSANASPNRRRGGSWNWGNLGRSLIGAMLGPGAVGGGDGGGGGDRALQAGARRGRFRELTPHEMHQTPEGKFSVSVWRKNKQDAEPVEVSVGVYDTAYEGQRAAESFSPPLWQEPGKDSRCAVCDSTFGYVLKRRHHCRNCGRLVCSACAERFWPRSMLPPTYNVDTSEKKVRVCSTCYGAGEDFRKACLSGSEEGAMAAFSTGCVNLRVPYTIYHNELPVHCAASGGNLNILAWLVDDRCCPLFLDREKKIALGDSRRLSVMGAAAASGHVQIMRYLAFTQGCKVTEIRDMGSLWSALEKCLYDGANVVPETGGHRSRISNNSGNPSSSGGGSGGGGGGGGGGGYPNSAPQSAPGAAAGGAEVSVPLGDDDNTCIVCFERKVDCTLVPCGHHCCCLTCAAQFEQCPVCRADVEQKIRAISV
ncbi:unnamed protein product [Ectocarpus sp. 4 AP-2014]